MDVLIIPIGQRTLRACVRDACDETEKTIYIYIYIHTDYSPRVAFARFVSTVWKNSKKREEMGGEKGEIEESDRFFFLRTVLRNRIRKISRPSLRKGIGGDDVSA